MKRVLLLTLVIFSVFRVFGKPVSEKEAARVARVFLSSVVEVEPVINTPEIQRIDYICMEKDTLIYLFHFSKAFVFISADDAAFPILGYGLNSAPAWSEAHSSVKGWMSKNLKELQGIRRKGLAATSEIENSWNKYLNGQVEKQAKNVEPLLYSSWNQNWPYNECAPTAPQGPGGKAFAGCVAVSMAQLIYYYRYPHFGIGYHGYYTYNYGYIQSDFSSSEYEYDGMVDDLSGTMNHEVAELLFDCGVAVEMSYGPAASGAYLYDVEGAMELYFGYSDSALYMTKSDFPDSVWIEMVRGEIDKGRPLIYAGYDPGIGAGHAFNLDGYQGADHFHFNWGWSGSYDGYYYLSSLTPGGYDYTLTQRAVFYLFPDNNYPEYCSATDTLTAMRGSFQDGSGHMNYQNNAACSWLISPESQASHIELEFVDVNLEMTHDVIKVYDGNNASAPLIASFSGDSIPAVISSSGSELFITFNSNSSIRNRGFHANYKAFPPVYCNSMTVLDAGAGTINDGSGIYPYNNNTFCKWFIKPSGASYITATVSMIDTHDADDYIAIYDPSTSPGVLLGTYYGDTQGAQVTSTSGLMLVVFDTDNKDVADGFEITYTSDAVNVNELYAEDLLVYPNPSSGNVRIEIPEMKTFDHLEIITTEGKLVDSFSENYTFDLNLPAGIYFLRLIGKQNIVTKKLIVTRNGL